MQLGGVVPRGFGEGNASGICEVEAHPSVIPRQRTGTRPDDFTARGEFVEHDRRIVAHADRKYERFPRGSRKRDPGQLVDHLGDAVDAAKRFGDMLPGRQKPSERCRVDRLNLVSQGRERSTTQPSEYFAITPLAADIPRSELTLHDPFLPSERAESGQSDGGSDAEPLGNIRNCERPVRSRKSPDQIAEGVIHRGDECRRDTDRERDAERIPEARRVFDDRPPFGARTPHTRASFELGEPLANIRRPLNRRLHSQLDFVDGEWPQDAEQIDDTFSTLHATVGREPLKFELRLFDNTRVEEFAQFRATQKLCEERRVE